MGQYTRYIQEHINNYCGQLSFDWKTLGYWRRLETVCSRYREIHGTNDLLESINKIGDRIGRGDVRELFLKGQFYDGYVAAMLWGGIDLTRRNNIQETNGYKALTIKKDVIVEKLKRVSDSLLKNDLKNAFLSFLYNGENRIEGVALSYFTKLLFFIPNNISPKPLIYDKWGIRIHAALMKDENINYNNFLSIYDPQPFIRGGNDGNVLFLSYLDYCSRINNLYGLLNIDSSNDIEAFLFGMPLRGAIGNDSERNPRKMLVSYLGLDNCNKHTAPKIENIEKKTERKGHSIESTSMGITDEFINEINTQFPSINISRNKSISNGPKAELIADVSNGWKLAVGRKKTYYFCGMYTKERRENKYPDILNNPVGGGYGYFKKFQTTPEALRLFVNILQNENSTKINQLTKNDIETWPVPVKGLLSNSVYYPCCYDDGAPVKFFNERFAEYGIQSYVYVDYGMKAEDLATRQDGFLHYHIFATRELKKSDLILHKWNPEKYRQYLSAQEIADMQDIFEIHSINPSNAFGRWIVYERDADADAKVGPEKFSLLYIAADGAATYAALYLENKIAPKALAIIQPGGSFGGNYTSFFDPDGVFLRIVNSGSAIPEYVLLKNDNLINYQDFAK